MEDDDGDDDDGDDDDGGDGEDEDDDGCRNWSHLVYRLQLMN